MACQKGSETRECRQRPHPRRIAHAQPMMGAVEQRETSPEELRPLGCCHDRRHRNGKDRSDENTSELQALMRNSYAVFCFNTNTDDAVHSQVCVALAKAAQ